MTPLTRPLRSRATASTSRSTSGEAVSRLRSRGRTSTFCESAEARDDHQSEPEHREALQASGLLDAVTEMRSRVFEDAELKLP
jgi:hypothetical protein